MRGREGGGEREGEREGERGGVRERERERERERDEYHTPSRKARAPAVGSPRSPPSPLPPRPPPPHPMSLSRQGEGSTTEGADEYVELDLDKTLTWTGNAVIVQRGSVFRLPLLVPYPSVLAIQFEVEGGYDIEFSLTFKEDNEDEAVVMVCATMKRGGGGGRGHALAGSRLQRSPALGSAQPRTPHCDRRLSRIG